MPQIDLSGKAFYFHETSSSNYVKLIPDKEEAVSAATICLRYHSTLTTDQCLFSFATPSKDNTFLLFKFGYGKHTMAVNNDQPELLMSDERTPSGWIRVCGTWETSSGKVQLWINGKGSEMKAVKKGMLVEGKPIIILGQAQDTYRGGFQSSQAFVGQITEVHMWDYVLSECEISAMSIGLAVNPGNVLNWKSMQYTRSGHVLVKSVDDTCYVK
ncbi:serum amyloid P-component-like [Huso huso]|uniref:Pentraxin family member n=1 Tax=Huso huso TaxID=61971 RepID=A0ABR0ZFA4_HUSHU